MESIGKQIRKYRERAGMTQSELATAIGSADKSRISKYENGSQTPSINKTLPAICAALGVTCEVMLYPKK